MSERVKGATSVSLAFRLIDSTTGAAKSGVDVTTLYLQYWRPGEAGGTATALTLLGSVNAAWTSYGAIEVDATRSKGVYRIDCPNAAFATGSNEVALTVTGSGIEPCTRLIDLTATNTRAADGGLTGLSASVPSGGIVAASFAADSITSSALATSAVTEITNAVLAGVYPAVIESGTAQAGTLTTLTLAATSTLTSGIVGTGIVSLTSGTGAGQWRRITNVNTTNPAAIVVTVADWFVTPDATTVYAITSEDKTSADLVTIKTQAVTCAAGVTVLASVGTAATSTAQTGDSFARIGATGSGLTSLATPTNITAATGVSLNLAQIGLTPRDLGAVADSALTVGDALVAAIAGAAGRETVVSTTYTVKTPFTGTVIRAFTLDSATAPTSRT